MNPINVLISIGNSDDKLSQSEWSGFVKSTRAMLNDMHWQLTLHGEWFSAPDQPWQNANWLIEIDADNTAKIEALKQRLRIHAAEHRQDSIAWTPGKVEFLEADKQSVPEWMADVEPLHVRYSK